MAKSSQQIDIQALKDLQMRFPDIPQGVVSLYLLQYNNNLEACSQALIQESRKYSHMDYRSSDENRRNRSRLLHINLGIHPHSNSLGGYGAQINGGHTLVHSSSDGHINPQHTAGKQLLCLVQEPHSAPATVAESPTSNPFFISNHSQDASSSPPQSQQQSPSWQPGVNSSTMHINSSYMHLRRHCTSPTTMAVPQNSPPGRSLPRALQVIPQSQSNQYGPTDSAYVRRASQGSPVRQNPQTTQWRPSSQSSFPHYNPCAVTGHSHQNSKMSHSPPTQLHIPQSGCQSPPTTRRLSPFNSPLHQFQPNHLSRQSYVFMPPSPSSSPTHSYKHSPPSFPNQDTQSMPYLPYGPSFTKCSMNKVELTGSPPHRTRNATSRSPSPINSHSSQMGPLPLYAATMLSRSPSRGMSSPTQSFYGVNPLCITCSPPTGPGSPLPSPCVMVTQPNPTVFKITVAPEPVSPMPRPESGNSSQKSQRKSSSGLDEYAYIQALLLHQRARMERLVKALKLKKEDLDRMKVEVNSMEHDRMNRRLRKVTYSTSNPSPEEMTRWRNLNRQLQINIDCTLKEIHLLQP
ncbi:TGF-beta-activated kinase 1 and MAP3K7-binding protein 3 [Ambystoma mexicanum]|uniref:TGF-beta-activated kinase 1 and MAP3K7-binding protein 3 n=1 Tax=Ambystoma mexicanum TaxID=8296 RepID=UPI0037E71B6A